MNQEQIGKFILECRNKKGLTQTELAEKLNVTNKTISKWENGKGLPDISLLEPLCDELDITVNELLNGEKIEKKNVTKKSEETIIKTLKYSNKKLKRIKKITNILIIILFILILLITSFYIIDLNRMSKNQEVLFSTWGKNYVIEVENDKILDVIEENMINDCQETIPHLLNEKCFVSEEILSIEEIQTKNYDKLYYVYSWVLKEKYYYDKNIIRDSESSIPYKFTIGKLKEKYFLVDSQKPGDGEEYEKGLKELFPLSIRNKIKNIEQNGTIKLLQRDISKQADYYYSSISIPKKLDLINNRIIEYFQDGNQLDFVSANYVDYQKEKVMIMLKENTEENQRIFKEKIINSDYLEFTEGKIERYK